MRLSDLKTGQSATILKVLGHGGFRRRIMEMGFVRGKKVEVVLNAPLRDPIVYKIMDYEVSLRRSEAHMVVVITNEEAEGLISEEYNGTREGDQLHEVIAQSSKRINVALVGNPNSGKTSLFNAISGGHEHVGNYSGVTVDAKRGHCTYRGYRFEITDLPGTYALTAYSPEELYVRRHLAEHTPDVIINAVVASNLERNLYLTTELIDLNPRVVVALNMYDELEASGAELDYDSLGRMLGVPMVPVVARHGRGIEALLDTVIAVYENEDDRVRHIHINQGPVIEESLRTITGALKESGELPPQFPPRYIAMKLLEKDSYIKDQLKHHPKYPEWEEASKREAQRIKNLLDEDIETAFADQKYGFISGALRETYTPGKKEQTQVTKIIDAFVTHKLWGFPIFFFLMWLMFYCTFNLGAYPQEWIEQLVGLIGQGVDAWMPDGALKDLLVDGVIGGVGSVIVFLPNIMILYLFIAFMEDSGYLARAAFIMDRIMHRIGLHGKSFIPLIMGFGCNVPAIMATRTIESRSSRLITILITPFMSCSARLPIYILLTGTFFSAHAGLVMTGLYVLGILVAVVTARLMRRFFYPEDETPFVMELPPYRMPTWKTTLLHMWDKCAQYLRKMGGMILIASIVVWFLSYYPRERTDDAAVTNYENSYLGRIGQACEPVFTPLGLNWKAGVALISGISAKEIVVSTLGVLYAEETPAAAGGGPEGTADATRRIASGEASQTAVQKTIIGGADSETAIRVADEERTLGRKLLASGDFSEAAVLGFLTFILLYIPCIATVVAIGSEAGWRWAAASVIYDTAVAWLMAWAVYHIASLFA